MFIGRIITKSKNIDTLDFVDVTPNPCSIDNIIPTLVIGKKNAESIYGKDKIKVLDKRITPNVSWTYAKNERRNDYERDLNKFNDNLIKNARKSIRYTYFNIFMEPLIRIKGLINFIYSENDKQIYISNNHIYIYYKKYVIGLSLEDLEYAGIGRKKVIDKIKSNKHNNIVEDNSFLSIKMKQYLKDDKILVPYLYFLSK